MRFIPLALLALPLALSGSGCSSSTVSAHELNLTVDYDGAHTQAVLAFADFDPAKFDSPGDSMCDPLFGTNVGHCEKDLPMHATIVSGDAPVNDATMSVGLGGGPILYWVFLNRAADDPQPPNDPSAPLFLSADFLDGDISSLGRPTGCTSEPAHRCTMTLSPH
jgi:hypothetical protein